MNNNQGKLEFASDSKWFPALFRWTFIKTLEFILSEEDGIQRTFGVNDKDFYHCHFLCKRPCHLKLEERLRSFKDSFDYERRLSTGDPDYDNDVTGETFLNFVSVMKRYQMELGQLVEQVVRQNLCKEPSLLCHTFEETRPKDMCPGDPRRNILCTVGEAPRSYMPPDMDYASSYMNDYCPIEQVPFLIDRKGQIHSGSR